MPIRGGDPTATQIRGQLASAQAMLASQPKFAPGEETKSQPKAFAQARFTKPVANHSDRKCVETRVCKSGFHIGF